MFDYAILDFHFSRLLENIFCTANSNGSLTFGMCKHSSEAPKIKTLRSLKLQKPWTSSLVLSLQWHPVQEDLIGATLSTGEVLLMKIDVTKLHIEETAENLECDYSPLDEDFLLSCTSVMTHDLEAWTIAFTPSGNRLLSGGDDSFLRCCIVNESLDQEAWTNRKIHGAGVTAILPLSDSVFLTGSYDEHLRIVEDKKKVSGELSLGGGVWRLKMIQAEGDIRMDQSDYRCLVLASCMHAGARVVEVMRKNRDEWELKIIAKFEKHDSMNYASDIQPTLTIVTKMFTIISTSFYDRLVCTWQIPA